MLNITRYGRSSLSKTIAALPFVILASSSTATAFELEEATIAGIHNAIKSGETTCHDIVKAYVDRAAAYSGVCTMLVTADGAPIPPATGYVRAGSPIVFPTATVPVASLLPNVDQYVGLPLDLGRMETPKSDPTVKHQMGMRVGIPNAGQINALETINLRGERSVSCKGACDAHPSTGPLPSTCYSKCEAFRQQPDALETAAALDAKYGRNPDLKKMPMYCVVVGVKDPYDTKDMRSTSNNDVNFAMDAPPFDSTSVARLRARGAIIYAKTQAHEFSAGPGNPGGPATTMTNLVGSGYGLSAWAGQSCNPYDTERVPRGSSSGSGPAVSANLLTIGLCEQSGASCQGPASRAGIALILTTQGLIPDSGGQGFQYLNDRQGIHARTLADAAYVLDAMRDDEGGYFDINGLYSAIPKSLISRKPYATYVIDDAQLAAKPKPLKGMRIAFLREHFVTPTPNHVAISNMIDNEVKTILRDKLGAELIESIDTRLPDDPTVPNLTYTFADAFSEIFPRYMPEVFSQRNNNGQLIYAVPGYDVESYDYLLKLSNREAPLSPNFPRITNIEGLADYPDPLFFKFEIDRYLRKRGDERITDWAAWVANAKFRQDSSRAGAENWVSTTTTIAEGKSNQLAVSDLARLALMKVMQANDIDAFVHPENTVPPNKIGGPLVGSTSLDGISPFMQIPRIAIPAGFVETIYEPRYALNANRTNYNSVAGTVQTMLPHPLPISITFIAGQGEEATLVKIGTAYESATHHRSPPPDFGPLGP